MHFRVARPDHADWLQITLNQPGRHNVLNALAAIAVAHKVGVSDAAIAEGLAGFQGIGRRFALNGELAIEGGTVTLVDDYAHHPRELAATVEAVRGCWPDRRIVFVFQPHRYSRTRDLMDDFSQVLAGLDPLVVTEVYAAGEEEISAADGRALCRSVRARGRSNPIFVDRLADLPEVLRAILRPGDVLLTMGAGSIGQVAAELAAGGLDAAESRV
jgi:UDP-N-acetylmuramate--alanine ligase